MRPQLRYISACEVLNRDSAESIIFVYLEGVIEVGQEGGNVRVKVCFWSYIQRRG